jgi:hypothetical protein
MTKYIFIFFTIIIFSFAAYLGIEFKRMNDRIYQAVQHCQETKDPKQCYLASYYYNQTEDYENARMALTIACEAKMIEACTDLAYTERLQGNLSKALEMSLETCEQGDNMGCFYSASFYCLMNNSEKTLHFLELALQKGYTNFKEIQLSEDLDCIRSHPNLGALIKKFK